MNIFILLLLLFPFSVQAQVEFSQESATALLHTLSVEIGPRPMGSPAEQRALEFAAGRLKAFGCDSVYIMPMTSTPTANTTSGIAVGIKHGATKRIILIGGHIDSAGPEISGANDDGSGSAVVLEAARILNRRNLQSTIVYCLFGGEEQGLRGSRHFVEHFDQIDSVAFMLQVDMANGLGVIDIDPDTHGKSAPSWLVSAAVEEFYTLGYNHLRYPTHFFSLNYALPQGSGSDHEAFLEEGIPAIDFSTDVSDPIHTPQDKFENFDPRGLKRSGDLVIRLVERFEGGVPSRETENYWLYLAGRTPLFIPYWGIWIFVLVSLLISVAAILRLHSRKLSLPQSVRWSGAKILLLTFIIAVAAWFSSDVVALIRGVRHPWFTSINSFYVLGLIAAFLGLWLCLHLARRLRISVDPEFLFLRGVILLWLVIILLGLLSVKLMVEPATGLLLMSMAILVRPRALKILLLLSSPWWMLRLLFSEWDGLIFRSIAMGLTSTTASLAAAAAVTLLLTIILLPFAYAAAALMRDTASLKPLADLSRSPIAGIASITAFIALAGYLTTVPVYDQFWSRDIRVDQYHLVGRDSDSLTVSVRSSEYLSGIRVRYGSTDTLLEGRTTSVSLPAQVEFDREWLKVERHFESGGSDTNTSFKGELRLACKFRPYKVSVTLSAGKNGLASLETPWNYTTNNATHTIDWYSFPDTVLRIPMEFRVSGSDSVKETVEVIFDSLAYPVVITQGESYVIPRTKFVSKYTYVR